MNKFTREQFNQMCTVLAENYGVESVTQQFTIEPSIQQELRNKVVEKSTFLDKINTLGVDDLKGQVLLGAANGRVSGRTDTSDGTTKRVPKNLVGLDPQNYELFKVNSDVFIPYALLDAWSKFPDFMERAQAWIQAAIANDWELIGWHGVSVAANSDIKANPLLEDVNKGWMQLAREYNSGANILKEGGTPGEVRIGENGDYANLDVAVNDLRSEIPQYKRTGLVALVGDELISNERAKLYAANGGVPTEKNNIAQAMTVLGGLPWETPSNFPSRGLVVTSHENLSIYEQNGKTRRHIKDEAEQDRITDYNSRNMGYVIEDQEKFAALEFRNVKVPNAAGTGWE